MRAHIFSTTLTSREILHRLPVKRNTPYNCNLEYSVPVDCAVGDVQLNQHFESPRAKSPRNNASFPASTAWKSISQDEQPRSTYREASNVHEKRDARKSLSFHFRRTLCTKAARRWRYIGIRLFYMGMVLLHRFPRAISRIRRKYPRYYLSRQRIVSTSPTVGVENIGYGNSARYSVEYEILLEYRISGI